MREWWGGGGGDDPYLLPLFIGGGNRKGGVMNLVSCNLFTINLITDFLNNENRI